MRADLHVHTTYSDSTYSPSDVIQKAVCLGLSYVAITDHDTVEGLAEAEGSAKGTAVEVVPGVEISTRMGESEIHILGLFIDRERGGLRAFLRARCEERRGRIYEMTAKLRALGLNICAEEVFAVAGGGAPGRMHVAEALVRAGQVGNVKEAFSRYISDDGPAYVARKAVTPAEAAGLIRSAGGVPVYTHPGLTKCDELIPALVRSGVMGIEVRYPTHNAAQVEFYTRIAEKHGLLLSGGSDCHGKYRDSVLLGTEEVDGNVVERLREGAERVRKEG